MVLRAELEAGGRTGRRRRTASTSRPSLGGVVLVGVGRFRCSWRKARWRGGLGGLGGGDTLCSMTSLGGCSCTTILVSRPERGGVVRNGSGQLRGVGKEGGRRGGRAGGGGLEAEWVEVRRRAVGEGAVWKRGARQQGAVMGGTGWVEADLGLGGPRGGKAALEQDGGGEQA